MELCRLCLTHKRFDLCVKIFNDHHNPPIWKQIEAFTNLTVSKTDPYSKLICFRCLFELEKSLSFQTMILENHWRIQQHSNDPIVKEEAIEIQEDEAYEEDYNIDKDEDKADEVEIRAKTEEVAKTSKTSSARLADNDNAKYEDTIAFQNFVIQSLGILRERFDKLDTDELQITPTLIDENDICEPVDTVEKLQQLDGDLQNKPVFMKMMQRLTIIGRQKLTTTVAFIMSKLMTNELASHYSWLGRKNKRSLHKFVQVAKLIIKTTVCLCPDITEKQVIKAVGMWLVQAPVRIKRNVLKNPDGRNLADL